jgi:triacylglycerol lipase
MNFSVWPPEVNSLLLLDGPGPEPMLEAAAAWDGIGRELSSAANAFSSVTSDLTGQAWQGSASASMTNTAAGYVDWLGGAAAQAEQSAAQARAAATAFESALATIVDPGQVTANRTQLTSLVISNLFGQNAPAIAAAEADYEQMWAQDVAAMGGYHANASAAVTQLGSWEQALENLPGFPGQIARTVANGVASVSQLLQPAVAPVADRVTLVVDNLVSAIFGTPASAPIPASQGAIFSGVPSLATRVELAGLSGLQGFTGILGIDVGSLTGGGLITNPLIAPLLSPFVSNTPPQLLTFLLGESVQETTSNGMTVVQITPAHPSGQYVVALHGGAYTIPPSIFHWFFYALAANQTGATFEVPIYPLVQQGGTAGTVVPAVAGVISAQIAQHGASHVSVFGDSAGGGIALASVEYMVSQGQTPPASLVLISPSLAPGQTNPNVGFVGDPLRFLEGSPTIGRQWAGNLPLDDPRVSPLNGSLSGLPPTYVYSGSLDSLGPNVVLLQQKAALQGAPFSFVLGNGLPHDWVLLTPDGFRYFPQIYQELGI